MRVTAIRRVRRRRDRALRQGSQRSTASRAVRVTERRRGARRSGAAARTSSSRTTPGSRRWSSRTATTCRRAASRARSRRQSTRARSRSTTPKSLLVLPLLLRRRGDRHAHARRARREAVLLRCPRDARGDRQPGRDRALRTASSTRRWRRWRRPTASPVSPTTARSRTRFEGSACSARSVTATRSRCCCATSISSRRSTTATATRSATRSCAGSPRCCRKCRARSTSRARYGGEDFAVLLDNVDVVQAKAVAERIRIEISKVVVDTDKGPLSVTESVGVAAFPDDGRDRATLIERADLALYHAKHTAGIASSPGPKPRRRRRKRPAEVLVHSRRCLRPRSARPPQL